MTEPIRAEATMTEPIASADVCIKCDKATPTVTQFAGSPETGFGMVPVCGICATPRAKEQQPVEAQPRRVSRLHASQRSAHDLVEEARARLKAVDTELARFDALRSERALLERILSCGDSKVAQ